MADAPPFPTLAEVLAIIATRPGPWVLDTFCCEGGAAEGFKRAGWNVLGVDNTARFCRRYRGHGFLVADAVRFLVEYGHLFQARHASPPCQPYSIATAGNASARVKHPRLIGATREAMLAHPGPWSIENVAQARAEMIDPVTLCGTMFGLHATDDDGTPLEMWRHRLFETSPEVRLEPPTSCRHGWHSVQVAGSYGGARSDKHEARLIRAGGYVPAKHVQEALLGIDWMTLHGLYQSLPPIYCEHLGHALMVAHLTYGGLR